MAILEIFLTSLLAVLVLFFLTRLIGYRQVAELTLFDYINGITLGSIGAELALAPFTEIYKPLIASGVFGLLTVLLSYLTDRSLKIRRGIVGAPLVLFHGQKFFEENMKKARLDLGEFLMQCREMGFFDLTELDTVLLEPNGKFSILPFSEYKPLSPKDMGVQPPPAVCPGNVILDGKLMAENLSALGFDEVWLRKRLKELKAPKLEDIYLAVSDTEGNLSFFEKSKKLPKDRFL